MSKRLWIMIAGPYTSGASDAEGRSENLRRLNIAALAVLRKGHIPLIGVNMALPLVDVAGPEYFDEIMMPCSLALAERCDAVLRIGGESKGADLEVQSIREKGGQVYDSIENIPDITVVKLFEKKPSS